MPLQIYCSQCRKVACVLCLAEHPSHSLSALSSVAQQKRDHIIHSFPLDDSGGSPSGVVTRLVERQKTVMRAIEALPADAAAALARLCEARDALKVAADNFVRESESVIATSVQSRQASLESVAVDVDAALLEAAEIVPRVRAAASAASDVEVRRVDCVRLWFCAPALRTASLLLVSPLADHGIRAAARNRHRLFGGAR